MICCPKCGGSAAKPRVGRNYCRCRLCGLSFLLEDAIHREPLPARGPTKAIQPKPRTKSGSGVIAGRIVIGRGMRWYI